MAIGEGFPFLSRAVHAHVVQCPSIHLGIQETEIEDLNATYDLALKGNTVSHLWHSIFIIPIKSPFTRERLPDGLDP